MRKARVALARRLGIIMHAILLVFALGATALTGTVAEGCTSSFSRFARRSLALRPAHSRRHLYVTCYTEGFSHFVTSMTAPVASGWSGCRVGLAPTGKCRLVTAHTLTGRCGSRRGRRRWADSDR